MAQMANCNSLSDCERACQVEEQCNGMIEYGLNICTEKEIDPNSGLMECTAPYSADAPGGPRDGRCVEEDKCECSNGWSQPSRHAVV